MAMHSAKLMDGDGVEEAAEQDSLAADDSGEEQENEEEEQSDEDIFSDRNFDYTPSGIDPKCCKYCFKKK